MAWRISGTSMGPRDILERMIPLLREGALDEIANLYAEDGVHELPFAPPGAPERIEGRERIRAYFETLSSVPLDFRDFEQVEINQTEDPEVIVAEYDVSGIVETSGATFRVRYLWVLRIREGEIVSWRDYWNPLEILQLQGISP